MSLAIGTLSDSIGLALVKAKVAFHQVRDGADSQVFGGLLRSQETSSLVGALQRRGKDAGQRLSIVCKVIAESAALFVTMVGEG